MHRTPIANAGDQPQAQHAKRGWQPDSLVAHMADQITSDDDLLTEAEVSDWIKYSRHRLQRWRRNDGDERGGPPFYRFDKKVLYKRSDVRLWLDSKRIAPQPRPDASSVGLHP